VKTHPLLIVGGLASPLSADAPLADYTAIAHALGAEILDESAIAASSSARLVRRIIGSACAQAWLAFKKRPRHRVLLSDSERIAIPLALLLKFSRAHVVHVAIGHRLSARKKAPFFRYLRVHSQLTRLAVHSRAQFDHARAVLGIGEQRLAFFPYCVDTTFWRPCAVPEEQLIVTAGLEARDYETLLEAVKGLDVQVVIQAGSRWSRRDKAFGPILPANVEVRRTFVGTAELRELYARAAIVVVPLLEVDFQAGVTLILEAMAMGKAVVVSDVDGQTDVVVDRRTRRRPGGLRPPGLVARLALKAGVPVHPNGFYVRPRDPTDMRRAITYLLEHPDERRALGEAGRALISRFCDVRDYAQRLRALVAEADSATTAAGL